MDFSLYRPNAGVVLLNSSGQVLLAERTDLAGAWQMPQGGMDEGEDAVTCALRELWEETGIRAEDVEVLAEHPEWLFYDFPVKKRKDVYLGQRQKWVLMRLKNDALLIDVAAAEAKEFVAHKWASFEQAIAESVDFRKPVYTAVFERFSSLVL